MKKIIQIFTLLLAIIVFSQDDKKAHVEKSLTGVQIGFFGAEIYNESRLSENVTLRSQITVYPNIWGGDYYSKTGFALVPAISVTPKYYYNLQKRAEKGKNIKNNAANYLSTKIEYTPDWFVISNVKDLKVLPSIVFIPTYGFRRNFAHDFNYELKAGVGIGKILKKGYNIQLPIELSFKIGYDF